MLDKLKKIAGNGIAYGVYYFLLCHLIGFIANIPFKSVLKISVPVALGTLVLNGFVSSRFTKREKTLRGITFQAHDAEKSRFDGIANHLIDGDLVSGKLCLTEEELVFMSHNKQEYRWVLTSFESFHFYPTIFNKGGEFVIRDKNGRKLMFEVDYIKTWQQYFL